MNILSFALALLAATTCHELGHYIAVEATGGTVTEFKITPGSTDGQSYAGYIKYEDGDPEYIALASFETQFLVLNGLLKYRETYPEKDNNFLKYWSFMTYIDLPAHVVASGWQEDNDINIWRKHSGQSKGWLAGAAGLQSYLYFNKIKSLSIQPEQNGLTLQYNKMF